MIARARMAFPGVLMGILLAGPALAAPTNQDTTGPQSASPHAAPATAPRKTRLPRQARATPRLSARALANLAYDDPRAVAAREGTEAAAPEIDTTTAQTGLADDWQQSGMASWYGGRRWQGHRTSSGATYDERTLTAAHATLPIGTRVRVTTADGSRSVVVEINDRPGTRSRIIDLSRGAASQLGILNSGVARVTLSRL